MRAFHRDMLLVAVLAAVTLMGRPAIADPLNPLEFTSLGTVTVPAGAYTLNTSGTPSLTGPGTDLAGEVTMG